MGPAILQESNLSVMTPHIPLYPTDLITITIFFCSYFSNKEHLHTTGSNSGKVSESRHLEKAQNVKGSIFSGHFSPLSVFVRKSNMAVG